MSGLVLAACSSKSTNGPSASNPQHIVYPLAVGNSWTYSYEQILTYRYTDDPPETTSGTIDVLDNGQFPIGGGIEPHFVSAMLHLSDTNLVAAQQLWEQDDGLFVVGTCGDYDEALLKSVPGTSGSVARVSPYSALPGFGPAAMYPSLPSCNRGFDSRYGLMTSLTYPLEAGKHWTYLDSPILGVTKRSTAWEQTQFNGNPLHCHRIEWSFLMDPSDVTVDYVSEIGLLKRTVMDSTIQIRRDGAPLGSVIADLVIKVNLLEFNPAE